MSKNGVSLDRLIAHGRTADVYLWGDDTILKLFHDWFGCEDIEYEFEIVRAVQASGVKAPAVQELIQVKGRNGLVYERVHGVSMFDVLLHRPWKVFSCARLLAELHLQMHQRAFSTSIPAQRERLRNKINRVDELPASVKESLHARLETLPEGDRVCHGDFHPGNVMVTSDGAYTIDWMDATRGNPLADVARTSIILLGMADNQVPSLFLRQFVLLFHSLYLRHYFLLHSQGIDEYRKWLPIIAGARMSEGIPELEKWLVRQARQ